MRALNRDSSIDTRQKLIDAFASVEEQAASGHYLSRIIAIAESTQCLPANVDLLKAFQAFLDKFHKPLGLDEFIYETSRAVLSVAALANLEPKHIRPIVWGLCLDALEDAGLQSLRRDDGL